MTPRPLLAAALALALALALPAGAAAAPPRASLPDVEEEVMCVECGTALSVSQSPVAQQERDLIRRDIARGMDKAQIKADLVRTYGPAVLAQPDDHGFDLTAWIVPIALVVLAAAGVAVMARRWRRAGAATSAGVPTAGDGDGLEPEDARRLDAELTAYDR